MKNFKKQVLAFFLLLLFFSAQFLLITGLPKVSASNTPILEAQDEFKTIGQIAYGQSSSGKPGDIRIMVVRIINVALTLLATIFFVLVVIAGFQWLTAGGNQEQAKAAMSRIKNAIIGLIITTASWAVSFYILTRLEAIARGDIGYMGNY
jgi:hypothetical protein